MLTVYTNTFARPDYVQLLAWALRATVREPYRFVVVVQPEGLRREWDAVDEVRDGTILGYAAWREITKMIDGPSVILHDDCVPVLPWDSSVFPLPHSGRPGGHTIFYHDGPHRPPMPVLYATRIGDAAACPKAWPGDLCEAAAAAHVEAMLDGIFLHLDKGTIAAPDCPANEAKPRLVAAIASHLGFDAPAPLTEAEIAVHPGRDFPSAPNRQDRQAGLGDIVAAGLSAIGVTKKRVQRLASSVGVKDCGCNKRQEALNALGWRIGIGEPPRGKAKSD